MMVDYDSTKFARSTLLYLFLIDLFSLYAQCYLHIYSLLQKSISYYISTVRVKIEIFQN